MGESFKIHLKLVKTVKFLNYARLSIEIERILPEFNLDYETEIDNIGETFDIDVSIDYSLAESLVYRYDESDIKELEELIRKIFEIVSN